MAALLESIGTYAMVPVHYVAETGEEIYNNIVWAGRNITLAYIENKDKIARVFEKCLANFPALLLLQFAPLEARLVVYGISYAITIATLFLSDSPQVLRILRPVAFSLAVDIGRLGVWMMAPLPTIALPMTVLIGVYYIGGACLFAFMAANAEHI